VTSNSQHKKKPPNVSGFSKIGLWRRLLDNFDYAATARVNQHRSIVYDRIAILASTVFLGHVVVGHACFRKLGANSYVALITIRWTVLLNHIAMKARSLVYPQYSCHTADDPSNRAANDGPNWTCGPVAFAGTTFDASGHALR
jgi:hypothetical protein